MKVLSGSSTRKMAAKVSPMTAGSIRPRSSRSAWVAAMAAASTSDTGRPRAAAARATSSYSGCALTTAAVVVRELDGDRLAVDLDPVHGAVEGVLGEHLLAQADGRGVPEDRRRARRRPGRRSTSTLRVWAGRPFFIRIGVSQASLAPASSRAVITDGQTRGSRSSTLVSSSSEASPAIAAAVADEDPDHVGVTLGVAGAGADPDRGGGHERLRSPRRGDGGQDGGAGRRAQLHGRGARRAGVRRDAAEQLGDGGRRDRQRAVGAAHVAGADGDRRDDDLGRAEVDEAGARSDDVGDRVEGARPRGSGRRRCRGRGRGPRRRRAARRCAAPGARPGSSRSASLSSASMSRQVRWCTESAISTWQRVAASPPRVTCSTRSLTGSGAIASTARCSTSTGTPAPTSAPSSMSPLAPAEASIQMVMASWVLSTPTRRATRAANTPAPYPLSMLTTVTPGAQELSIASSAARPPNDAPYPTLVGTATIGTPTRPPTTDGSAPSMPATTTRQSACSSSSRTPSSRCSPATPTSRISCDPGAVHAGGERRLGGDGRVGRAGADDRDRARPAWAAGRASRRGRPGRRRRRSRSPRAWPRR